MNATAPTFRIVPVMNFDYLSRAMYLQHPVTVQGINGTTLEGIIESIGQGELHRGTPLNWKVTFQSGRSLLVKFVLTSI